MNAPQNVPRMHINFLVYYFMTLLSFNLNQSPNYEVNHQFPILPMNITTTVAVLHCYFSVLRILDDDNDSMHMHAGKKPHEFHHSHSCCIGNISNLRTHTKMAQVCVSLRQKIVFM